MSLRAAALVVALCLGSAASAAGAGVDARALFAEGQFDAAGAEYEARWAQGGRASDGVNAVISWRAAGRYAHARVLLEAVRAVVPAGHALAARVALLVETLDELTGRMTIEAIDPAAHVLVDGAPPERMGGEIILDAGRRDLAVSKEGCAPLRKRLEVMPRARLRERIELECGIAEGNLHVTVFGGGQLFIDDTPHKLGWNTDLAVPAGRHRVSYRRGGVVSYAGDLVVEPRQTTRLRVKQPLRAAILGVFLGSSTVAAATAGGESSLFTGAQVGFVLTGGPGVSYVIGIDFGTSWHDVNDMSSATAFGMTAAFRFVGPTWQTRRGGWVIVLDVDPIAFRLSAATSGEGDTHRSVLYYFLGAATLSAGHARQGWHVEATLMPAGVTSAKTGLFGASDGVDYAFGLGVTLGWAPLRL